MLMVLIWAGNMTAIRVLVTHDVGPVTAAALRFSLALTAILGWARLRNERVRIEFREFVHFVPLVALFVVQILLFNVASMYTDSGRVGVILYTNPFWVMVASGFIFSDDRHTVKGVLGSLVAMAGVTAVFWESFTGAHASLLGDSLVLLSALCLAGILVYVRVLMKKGFQPMQILTGQMVGAIPFFIAMALLFEFPLRFPLTPVNLAAILYQGLLVGGVAFIIYQQMNRIYRPSQLSSYFFLVPFFAVAYGAVLLKEPVTPGLVIGMVFICSGIFLTNTAPGAQPDAATPQAPPAGNNKPDRPA